MPISGSFNNILLVCIGGIGDIVMMTPVIEALRKHEPAAALSILTIPRSRDAALNVIGKGKVYALPMVYKGPSFFSIARVIALALHLRKQRFDLLINLRATETESGRLKMFLLTQCINPRSSIGRNINGKGAFYTISVSEQPRETHTEVELTARLLEPLGIRGIDTLITYGVKPDDRACLEAFLKERGITAGATLIGMNPGAFRPSRRWPLVHWKLLIALINKRFPGCRIVVTGETRENAFASGLCVADNVLCTNGALTIGQLAALCERLAVFITNDTGPMHLAAAVGTKVVALFGPGDVERFTPSVPGDRFRIVRTDEVTCKRPCYKFTCDDPRCLMSISPQQVMTAVGELLRDA
jgi:ADP-heptose:LPS heptosyltransferase